MTWLLLIKIMVISTCSEGYRFCPPAKPPVEQKQMFTSEAVCQASAERVRRYFPERRTLMRGKYVTMEQVTTVQCSPQAKS
jgi:hypothetical protein